MSGDRYTRSAALTQAGAAEWVVSHESEWHQVGLYAMPATIMAPDDEVATDVVAAATTGRAAVQVKAYGAASFEPLTVAGVPVELSVNQTLPPFRARLAAIRLDVTGVDGAVSITASGW